MKLGIIQGSTRLQANTLGVAKWATSHIAATRSNTTIVPLQLHNLPWELDPIIGAAHPASPPEKLAASYSLPSIQAFSAKVSSCDAILIITPQYNWSIPAPLKNAMDQLYWEWRDKPIGLFTFGGHGGGKCADALRIVLGGLKSRAATKAVAMTLPREYIVGEARLVGEEAVFASIEGDLNALLEELEDMSPGVSAADATS